MLGSLVKAEEAPLECPSSTERPPPSAVKKPSAAQQQILDAVLNHRDSIFYTGSAGVGKSYTTTKLIEALRRRYGSEDFAHKVVVTAPTGIAASHIKGSTIHSASGAGVPTHADDFSRIFGRRVTVGNERVRLWAVCEHLILDEVSMLSGEFFDQFELQVIKEGLPELPELPPISGGALD